MGPGGVASVATGAVSSAPGDRLPKAGTSSGIRRCFRYLAPQPSYRRFAQPLGIEGTMATRQNDQIVETATEARQAEPGPSVLALLTVSTGLAVLILGVVWFVFFRT
jgi:hypothetical protein